MSVGNVVAGCRAAVLATMFLWLVAASMVGSSRAPMSTGAGRQNVGKEMSIYTTVYAPNLNVRPDGGPREENITISVERLAIRAYVLLS